MLVTTKEMLLSAQSGCYAVGAFNVENLEFVMAVVAAAEERRSPVILQTTPGTVRYASLDYFLALARVAAERASVPVAMHLDHGGSFDLCLQAIRAGYTSVMIDGSHEPFEENVAITAAVARAGRAAGVPVEAELGRVGGKEDDGPDAGGENPFTDPDEAAEFVERTGCTSLAVGVGTAHGVYKGTPHVEQGILREIRRRVDVPLVLHGTSGVPDSQVREAIAGGVCKVNYATELRQAFTEGCMAHLAAHPCTFDPKSYAAGGMAAVREVVASHMDNLGCAGRA